MTDAKLEACRPVHLTCPRANVAAMFTSPLHSVDCEVNLVATLFFFIGRPRRCPCHTFGEICPTRQNTKRAYTFLPDSVFLVVSLMVS